MPAAKSAEPIIWQLASGVAAATVSQVCVVQVPPAAVHSASVFLLLVAPEGVHVVHKGSRTFPMTVVGKGLKQTSLPVLVGLYVPPGHICSGVQAASALLINRKKRRALMIWFVVFFG